MGASEIGVEELLLQKRYHKNNLDCTGTNEETYCSSTIKKIMGKIEHCNYFWIFDKHSIINCRMMYSENCMDLRCAKIWNLFYNLLLFWWKTLITINS